MEAGFSSLIGQLLNGLAGASSLFLVAAGLSLIFGVTRIVNFAHGSFYMLGLYVAYTLVERLSGSIGFWPALLLAPLATGVLGAVVEMALLRRIYRARSCCNCWPPLRWCWWSKTRCCGPGALKSCLAPRAGAGGLRQCPRAAVPCVRPAVDRHWPRGAGRPVVAAAPHALGHAGARRHARPRDGRRPGREPGLAVHQRVCPGRVAGRAGWCAAAAARARQPGAGHAHHWRRLRGGGGGWHGLAARRLCGCVADCRAEGAVHLDRSGRGGGVALSFPSSPWWWNLW